MLDPRRSLLIILVTATFFTAEFSQSSAQASGMYQVTDLGVAPANFFDPIITTSGQVITDPLGGSSLMSAGTYSIRDPETGPAGSIQTILYQNGSLIATLTTLVGPLENDQILGNAVNKSGMVVGTEFTPTQAGFGTPFYYTVGGGMHAVPLPYSMLGAAFSVNDMGLIVGSNYGLVNYNYGPRRAFLSNGQTSWDLNTLIAPGSGLTLTSATYINDSGQIAGFGNDSKGQEHIVLLTPTATPEPSVLMILGAGILAIGVRKARSFARPGQEAA